MGLLALGCSAALALGADDALAAQLPVSLGKAGSFAALGGQTVTSTGLSTLNGDLGVSPGSSLTGFPPGKVNGTVHATDPVASQAQADLTTAYNDAAGRQPPQALPADVGGQTLAPGVYKTGATPALGLTGTLTLDAQGDSNAVFVIQVGSALTTAVNSHVNLIGGAQAANVFWQIGSSATLGTSSTFAGTILALTSISINSGVTLNGRALARNGAVTLIDDTINVPTLPLPPPPPPPPPPHPCRLGAAPAEPAVPPITAAPKTAAWEQQYALGQRIMFGLPTSPQSIAAAAADPAATSDDLGTPLTPAEHAQLLAADSSGQNLEAVAQTAQGELPTSFAGAWYQYDNGGTIYVSFTSQACPSQAQLAQFAHMSGVRTVAVGAASDSTITRLNALQTAIDADTPMLRSQGVLVNRTEVDTPHNQALVTLDPSSVPGAQSIMTKRYGPGLAFAPAAPPAQPLDARYNPPQSKVNGGQDITDGNGRCTANISISSTKFSKGSYFVMTAGHCFHKGVFASQNGHNLDSTNGNDANLFAYTASKSIGHVAHTPVYNGATTNCDCEALGPISASRASSYTVVNHDNLFKFDFYAQSNKYFTHSPRACEDGISEYLRFGHIICGNIDNAHVTVGECEVMRVKGRCPKGVISYTVTDMIHVKYDHGADPLNGDSGAPTGNGPTLLGLVTDGRGDSSKARNMSDIYHTGHWIVPGH